MGLVKAEILKNGYLGLWEINESIDDLLKMTPLLASEKNVLQSFTHINRQQQWLATRLLLMNMLDSYQHIIYNDNGKPLLANSNKYISISHTKSYVSCLVSETNCGVDIEQVNEKIKRIAARFLSKEELEFAGNNTDILTILWCSKEALYKLHGKKQLSFIEQLKINSFELKDRGSLQGEIINDGKTLKYILNFQKLDGHILVYVIE
jgi:4'-phosphopantetheinyl transferase